MNILVTYHDHTMTRSAAICRLSALQNGVDKVVQWTRPALEQTEFYEKNREILDTPRGSGLWAWKPYIILDALNKAKPADLVIYSDVGVEFIAPVSHVIKQMGNIWLFGNMFKHLEWTKADCFIPILSNQYYSYEGKQCQASVLFVRKTTASISFIIDWLNWCCIPELINDAPSKLPNVARFQEHRHDQSILTCTAIRHHAGLNWWPAVYNMGAFTYSSEGYAKPYPPIFHHHRSRDSMWNDTDDLSLRFQQYFRNKYGI